MNKDLEKIHKEIERYREKIKYDTVDYPIESICRRFENKKIIMYAPTYRPFKGKPFFLNTFN